MSIQKRKTIYWLMGAVILFPLFYLLGGHNVFYLQIFVIGIFLFFYILRHKKHSLTLLDQVVLVYLLWVFACFILNALFELDPKVNIHRFISFFVFVGYMSSYLISRNYFRSTHYLKYIFLGTVGVYSIFFIYVIWQFLTLGTGDLFVAREILRQRLPMIIGFIIIVAMYYVLNCSESKRVRIFLYCFCITGIILILLSLTRAVYLQLIIGVFLIIFMVFKSKKNFLIKKTLWGITIFVAVIFLINSLGLFNFETVKVRFGDLLRSDLYQQDVSASDRFTVWTGLLNNLSQQPLRLILGYGQLGPSYVGPEVVSPITGRHLQLYSAHSEHLDVLIRNGIVGLLIFLGIWIMVIYKGFLPNRELPREAKILFAGHSIALLGVLGYGFFHETVRFPIFGMYFWFYLGIVSAILYSKKEAPPESSFQKKRIHQNIKYD